MRYVMRIAKLSESSKFWTQIALLGNSSEHASLRIVSSNPNVCWWSWFWSPCKVQVETPVKLILFGRTSSTTVNSCCVALDWLRLLLQQRVCKLNESMVGMISFLDKTTNCLCLWTGGNALVTLWAWQFIFIKKCVLTFFVVRWVCIFCFWSQMK